MAIFLQMLGAVFLGLILVLIAAYLWLRWKIRRFTREWAGKLEAFAQNMSPAAMGLMYVPPMTLQLTPAEESDAAHPQELELATLEVQNLGFQRGKLFVMGEIGGICRAMFHPERKVDAVVYDHPLLGVWIDFAAHFADGSSLSFSNCTQKSGLDQPPDIENRYFPGEQIAALWERFRRSLPEKPLADIAADGFPQRFEDGHRREMEWRISRGGVTEEEVRRCVEMGGGEFSDEHCDMVQRAWRMRIAQHIDDRLREAFLAASSMSLTEYENARDRLVFVHDHTSAEQLLMYMEHDEFDDDEGDDPDEDFDEDDDDFFDRQTKLEQRCQTSSPRQVFRELLAARELRGSYKFLREMTEPYAADVYLSSRALETI
jgi:hypothetical protein